MLFVKEISKSFAQRGLVLDNLCLEVEEGETVAIMGPSGSGKTTLINIIGLLDKPDTGDISFRGVSVLSFTEDEAADYRNLNIGFVFQEHLLLPYLTVSENIALPLMASKNSLKDIKAKEQKLKVLMERTGIYSLRDSYPFRISGGEAQRVALVRALSNNPSILLADEPTGSLDAKNAEKMGELLVEINRTSGIAIIMATHSVNLANKMSKTWHLEEGKLVI
ncbi:MAG: ABC transporter ATP-binding protein [Bacteroidales bacterium]